MAASASAHRMPVPWVHSISNPPHRSVCPCTVSHLLAPAMSRTYVIRAVHRLTHRHPPPPSTPSLSLTRRPPLSATTASSLSLAAASPTCPSPASSSSTPSPPPRLPVRLRPLPLLPELVTHLERTAGRQRSSNAPHTGTVLRVPGPCRWAPTTGEAIFPPVRVGSHQWPPFGGLLLWVNTHRLHVPSCHPHRPGPAPLGSAPPRPAPSHPPAPPPLRTPRLHPPPTRHPPVTPHAPCHVTCPTPSCR